MKQKKQIIMLPSEKSSQLATFKKTGNFTKPNFNVGIFESDTFQPQHLYILSDEEIKDGDWYYSIEFKVILQSESTSIEGAVQKIIATTDPDLTLEDEDTDIWKEREDILYPNKIPQIHQHIIEAYAKKPFDEVEVEYWNKSMAWMKHEPNHYPKLNPDGTLAVSLVIGETPMQQLIDKIDLYEKTGGINMITLKAVLQSYLKVEEKWIKENL